MGYDLHITRRKDWSLSGNDIAAAEWLAYVAQDPELSLWPENGRTWRDGPANVPTQTLGSIGFKGTFIRKIRTNL